MMTTAVPEGESAPTISCSMFGAGLEMAVQGSPCLSNGMAWDGGDTKPRVRLQDVPTVRLALGGPLEHITRAANPFISTLFTAVILGVLDAAIGAARDQLRSKAGGLRAFEQVEWSRAELDYWVAVQAYEGALRAVEAGHSTAAFHAAIRAKQAVADLAEQIMLRLTRVLGAGTFSQRSNFAHWFEDVRALGFLRPPWGLAYDVLFNTSIE